MKKLVVFLGLIGSISLYGQPLNFANQKMIAVSKSDSIRWSNLSQLKYDNTKGVKLLLPQRVDNSSKIYFPEITYQPISNCGQCSGVKYTYSYELNRILNRSSKNPMNLFSEFFNVFATAQGDAEHTLKTWENMKSIGCVTDLDLGYQQLFDNGQVLNGYNWYYKAMQNQVDDYFCIPLDSEEGILTMKHWLHNHLNGDSVGGIGIIYLGIQNNNIAITSGFDIGKIVIPEFTPHGNHSMTIVGFDDRIEYDFNGDGLITNDMDITGDGLVDVRDWEKGAVILANSYGSEWANNGYVYVMYRTLALPSNLNGIWNRSMYVVKPKLPTHPKTTFRFSIAHRNKNRIKVYAGVSSNSYSTTPERTIEIPFFNTLQPCIDTLVAGVPIEYGFDVTPLLNFINPGQKARFFFQVLEIDPRNQYNGYIQNFSVIDYTHGSMETVANSNPVNVVNNGLTTLYVDVSPEFSKPKLIANRLPNAEVGNPYRATLTSQKGTPPYRYSQTDGYLVTEKPFVHPNYDGFTQLTLPTNTKDYIKCIPEFPILIYDSVHTGTIYINPNGYIHLRENEYEWPFLPHDYTHLKAHTAIAPLMSKLVFDKPTFGVWKKSTPDTLFVRWIGRFETDVNSYLDFSACITKQGDITFYYDSIRYTSYDAWLRGISKGNGVELAKVGNDYFINQHSSYQYKFIPIDTSITITSDGTVSTNPTAAFTNKKINITLLDNNDLETNDVTYLSTGTPPSLTILSYSLNSDNLGWYSPLDTVKVSVVLKNRSGSTLSNIPLKLVSTSSNIEILQSNTIIPEILPNSEILVNNVFSIKANPLLKADIIEGIIVQNSTTNEQISVINIQLTPFLPIEVGKAILDSITQNNLISNTAQTLLFPVFNHNRMAITGISASLQTTSNLVELLNSSTLIDTMPPFSVDTLRFKIATSDVSSTNAFISFSGQLIDSYGTFVPFLETYIQEPSQIEDYENANQLFIIPSDFSDTIPYQIANIGCNSNQSLKVTKIAVSNAYNKYRGFSFTIQSCGKIEFDYLVKRSLIPFTSRFGYEIDGQNFNLENQTDWKHIVLNLNKGTHQFILKYFLKLSTDTVFIDNLKLPIGSSKKIGYSLNPNEIKMKCKPDTILNFNIEANNIEGLFSEIYYDLIPSVNTSCNWLSKKGAVVLNTNQSTSLPYTINTHGLAAGNYSSYIRFYDQHFYNPVKVSLEVIDNYQPPSVGSILVYPNPATNKVSFDFISSDAETATLNIYDILGQTIYSQEQFINYGSDLKTVTFDLSNCAREKELKGLFLYQLKVNSQVYKGKIILLPTQ